jgi:hypothetical protein
MAATTMSIKYRDAETKTTTEVLHFPVARTLAQLQSWATTAIAALDDSIGLVIESVTVQMVLDVSGMSLKETPVNGYTTSRGGLLSFSAADDTPYSVFIPGLLASFTDGGGVSIGGTLDTFRDALIDGIDVSGTVIKVSARTGSELETFRRSKLTDRDKL